ncbi:hypothetical protein Hypma_002116 [Hypsizygus marmoreus]|uniref:Uncharacterized protein n=1 Tax=Hypsizygus marmoreus TaxID=39966 RepID=A0A369KA83_HYPMA|nr:hypothetical protein Hypma_002116 [Hypsizygus marmoreus]
MPEQPEVNGFCEALAKNHGHAWIENYIRQLPVGSSTPPTGISGDNSESADAVGLDDFQTETPYPPSSEPDCYSDAQDSDDESDAENSDADSDDHDHDDALDSDDDDSIPLVLLPFLPRDDDEDIDAALSREPSASQRVKNNELEEDPELFCLEIHAQMFSTGFSEKEYTSMTVDRKGFSGPVTLDADIEEHLLPTCLSRSRGQPWLYLLNKNSPGPLCWAQRGKLMIIAAGPHALLIHFGLEAHIMCLDKPLYTEIVSKDIPGPNLDPDKADAIRSFVIPDRLIVPGSSPVRPRTINIFAAFVSDKRVWIVCDFARLIRLHVISRDAPWTKADLTPSSANWFELWEHFKGGPDWFYERRLAERHLRNWRSAVLKQYRAWRVRWRSWKAKADQRSLLEFITAEPAPKGTRKGKKKSKSEPKGKQMTTPALGPAPAAPAHYLIKDICRNSHRAFSGLGRHTANDLLFRLGLFPGMPCYVLCLDGTAYRQFKAGIFAYLSEFRSPQFLKRVSSTPNSLNPFTFNDNSHEKYLSRHIDVFRRTKVRVT